MLNLTVNQRAEVKTRSFRYQIDKDVKIEYPQYWQGHWPTGPLILHGWGCNLYCHFVGTLERLIKMFNMLSFDPIFPLQMIYLTACKNKSTRLCFGAFFVLARTLPSSTF